MDGNLGCFGVTSRQANTNKDVLAATPETIDRDAIEYETDDVVPEVCLDIKLDDKYLEGKGNHVFPRDGKLDSYADLVMIWLGY